MCKSCHMYSVKKIGASILALVFSRYAASIWAIYTKGYKMGGETQ